jgi:hypothetical protein
MKKSLKLLTFSMMAAAGSLLLAFNVFALRIDSARVIAAIAEDGSYSGVVNVDNPNSTPVSVKVYVEDFVYVEPFTGDKELFARGVSAHSLSNWLTYSPQQFILDPHASKQVNFTIAPKGKFNKTHCGVVFFESSMGNAVQDGKAVEVIGRLGMLLFADPAGFPKEAKLTSLKAEKRKITGILSNEGKVFVEAAGSFYVMDSQGMVLDRSKLPTYYLLPENKAKVALNFSDSLPAGSYTAIVTFDLQNEATVVKEIDFSLSESGEVKVLETRD